MNWIDSVVLFSAGLAMLVLSLRLLCLVLRRERKLAESERRMRGGR
ncbi:MAG: hypothetical protein ACRD9L_23670 [Bryobacteraceae bacterium]